DAFTDPARQNFVLTTDHLQQIADVLTPYFHHSVTAPAAEPDTADLTATLTAAATDPESGPVPAPALRTESAAPAAADAIDTEPPVDLTRVHPDERNHLVKVREERVWRFSNTPPQEVFRTGFTADSPDSVVGLWEWADDNPEEAPFVSTTRDPELWYLQKRYRYEIVPLLDPRDGEGIDVDATLDRLLEQGLITTESPFPIEQEVVFTRAIHPTAVVSVYDRVEERTGFRRPDGRGLFWAPGNLAQVHPDDRAHVERPVEDRPLYRFSDEEPADVLAEGFEPQAPNTFVRLRDWVEAGGLPGPYVSSTRNARLPGSARYRYQIDAARNAYPAGVDVAATMERMRRAGLLPAGWTHPRPGEQETLFVGRVNPEAVVSVYDTQRHRTGTLNETTGQVDWVDGAFAPEDIAVLSTVLGVDADHDMDDTGGGRDMDDVGGVRGAFAPDDLAMLSSLLGIDAMEVDSDPGDREAAQDPDAFPAVNYAMVPDPSEFVVEVTGERLFRFSGRTPEQVFQDGFVADSSEAGPTLMNYAQLNGPAPFVSTTRNIELWFNERRYRYEIHSSRNPDPVGIDLNATLEAERLGGYLASHQVSPFSQEEEVTFTNALAPMAVVSVYDRGQRQTGFWNPSGRSVDWLPGDRHSPIPVDLSLLDPDDRPYAVSSAVGEQLWRFSDASQDPERVLREGFRAAGSGTAPRLVDWVEGDRSAHFVPTGREHTLRRGAARYRYQIDPTWNSVPVGVDVAATVRRQQQAGAVPAEWTHPGLTDQVLFPGSIDPRAVLSVYDTVGDRTGRWNPETDAVEWTHGQHQRVETGRVRQLLDDLMGSLQALWETVRTRGAAALRWFADVLAAVRERLRGLTRPDDVPAGSAEADPAGPLSPADTSTPAASPRAQDDQHDQHHQDDQTGAETSAGGDASSVATPAQGDPEALPEASLPGAEGQVAALA
ncbi:scabin-related ADP-ribosyltransferase, partial [Streptomyces sp. NPDC002491]